jgi:urease accessory protein
VIAPAPLGAGIALVRLLHLASPALPIGAYSYSQGLEWVVGDATVHDAPSAQRWIGDLLDHVVPRGEAALAWRLLNAAEGRDWSACKHWNATFLASRETAELSAETEQTGHSLMRLVRDLALLDDDASAASRAMAPVTLPAAFALAARAFCVPATAALTAYIWAWLENQVLCAMKSIPLGQLAGQRMLLALGEHVPPAVIAAQAVADDELTNFAPGLAIASSRHETQYTRLFRS